jgi:hypothetical protein
MVTAVRIHTALNFGEFVRKAQRKPEPKTQLGHPLRLVFDRTQAGVRDLFCAAC